MARRIWLVCVLAVAASAPPPGWAGEGGQEPALTYVRDLPSLVGQTVTVKGRTGFVRESPAGDGCTVYTLRDDYDYRVDVHIKPSEKLPIMGATYYVTGEVRPGEADQAPYLEETSHALAYGGQITEVVKKTETVTRVETPPWLAPLIVGAALLAVLAMALIARTIARRRAAGGALAPPWGYVEVVSGPHQGLRVALREEATAIGRHLDPVKEVTLDGDRSVSRKHGVILREGDSVYYVDTNSTNGSFVNEQPAPSGQRVPISPGALIRVGPNTVLRVEHPEAGDVTRGLHVRTPGNGGMRRPGAQ